MAFRYAEYDAFAWIYNRYWGQHSVQRFLPVIEKLVLPHLAPHARILDLCCGTGQLAQALAQRGYQVTGMDGPEEMIRYARINAPAVEFIVEDAQSFHLPEIYHAVVSVYDCLNHIMSMEDLSLVFRNVQSCLLPGDLFLFILSRKSGPALKQQALQTFGSLMRTMIREGQGKLGGLSF